MAETGLVRWPFVVGPMGLLGGWLLMRVIDGDVVPGFWWTAAHLVWLAGFIAFTAVGVQLRAAARPGVLGAVAGWAVVVGAVLNASQMIVDVAVGAPAGSREVMTAALAAVENVPGVEPVFYTVGPSLMYLAVLVLAVLLARRRTVPPWAATAVALGVLLTASALLIGRDTQVVGAGMAVLGVGLVGLTSDLPARWEANGQQDRAEGAHARSLADQAGRHRSGRGRTPSGAAPAGTRGPGHPIRSTR